MEFNKRYNRVRPEGIEFEDTGMTKPEFKESCDINFILAKYHNNGILPIMKSPALFGDYSNALDFHQAQEIVRKAMEQFEELPSKLRDRFQNDPAQFLEFMEDGENHDEAVRLGLLPKPVVESTPVVEETTPE